jgi:hypothetical protein
MSPLLLENNSSPKTNRESTGVEVNDQTSDLINNTVEFTQYFHEGYCKITVPELDDCHEVTEAVTDGDSNSSHCEREKPEEDGDNDDVIGGVFAFCEEGNFF